MKFSMITPFAMLTLIKMRFYDHVGLLQTKSRVTASNLYNWLLNNPVTERQLVTDNYNENNNDVVNFKTVLITFPFYNNIKQSYKLLNN